MSKIKHSFFENLAGWVTIYYVSLFVRARNFLRSSARKYNIGPVTWGKCGVIPGLLTPASWLKIL